MKLYPRHGQCNPFSTPHQRHGAVPGPRRPLADQVAQPFAKISWGWKRKKTQKQTTVGPLHCYFSLGLRRAEGRVGGNQDFSSAALTRPPIKVAPTRGLSQADSLGEAFRGAGRTASTIRNTFPLSHLPLPWGFAIFPSCLRWITMVFQFQEGYLGG